MGKLNEGVEILDEQRIRTEGDIIRQYPKCKCIVVGINMDDLSDDKCRLYAVSRSRASYDELGQEYLKLHKMNIINKTMIGSYDI